MNIDNEDLTRIQDVLDEAYAPATRGVYGTGLFAFHYFCELKNIGEEHRAPVQQAVLASFIALLIGTFGGGSIRNYVYGIRAWHIIHGIRWEVNNDELKTLFEAGNKLAPKQSKKREKEPWTIDYLKEVCKALNRNNPKDAAVLACLTTAFWGTARLGEVTVPKLDGFNPSLHVKPVDVKFDVADRNNLMQTVIFIPWTKVAKEKGEEIFWAEQDGPTDPKAALKNHLDVNAPPPDSHLFSYKHGSNQRPMTRTIFLARISQIVKQKSMPKLPGHGIRVGSTLEYLLRGVPFDVVKAKGRWQSEAFRGYLQKHTQIMGPHIQSEPIANDLLVRYAMPPIR